jgi:sulfopropanediol 3-dehydrogenase
MAITYLKTANPRPAVESKDVRDIVAIMLANIDRDGEAAVRDYAQKLDGWTGEIVLSQAARKAACARVYPGISRTISALRRPISSDLLRRRRQRWANAK